MVAKKTELVSLTKDNAARPGLAVCYARGVFSKQGHLHRVERTKRTLVSRALCVVQYYGPKCRACPHSNFRVRFKAQTDE